MDVISQPLRRFDLEGFVGCFSFVCLVCLFFGCLFGFVCFFKGLRMVEVTSQEEHHAKLPLR